MAQFVPVSRERHGGKAWRRFDNYAFAASRHYVPVVGAELLVAATTLPIAFVKTPTEYVLVAMLSLVSGRNMLVDSEGNWLGGAYVPASFRSHPFLLLRKPNTDDWVLSVDEESSLVVDAQAGGEAFWDQNGNLGPSTNAILQYLGHLERDRVLTQKAVSALAAEGAICPWDIKIGIGEEQQPLEGLYRVDEAALGRLSDASFVDLRRGGALPLAYAQLISMANLPIFGQLGQFQEQINRARQRLSVPGKETQDGGVQLLDEPTLKFD